MTSNESCFKFQINHSWWILKYCLSHTQSNYIPSHRENWKMIFLLFFLAFLFPPPHSINAHYKTKKRQLLIMGIGIQSQKHFSTSFKLFSSHFWSVLLLGERCVLSYSSLINRWRTIGGPDKALFREQTHTPSCLWCPRVEFNPTIPELTSVE